MEEKRMYYKPDWDKAKKMLEAYWNQENEGRCLLGVTAYDKNKVDRAQWAPVPDGTEFEEHWLNIDKMIDRYENWFENTYFAAESVPFLDVYLGAGITAAYFGAGVRLAKNTIWFEHVLNDWEKDNLKFDEKNIWWQKTKEITKKASEASRGRFMVGVTDLSGTADIIAHLRGTEQLCTDLIDYPEKILEARDEILKAWFYCIDELYTITQTCQEGSIDWMGLWAPKLHHSLQCDFSAMLSPRMFEEFFISEIQAQCRKLPYSMFHLDGPDCLRHLDLLLDIPELDAIQWEPGAGQPGPSNWIPVLKKIQERGKSVQVNASYEEVETLLENLSPKGLYINIYQPFSNRQEADDFISKVDRLCKSK
jgi:hypothetical protein